MDPAAARVAALRLLARREFGSAELESRLREKGFGADVLADLIQELREERLLDDLRYATSYVRNHAGRGQGPRRIRMGLKEAQLPDALITEALESAPDFHAIARSLRVRRFGAELPADWPERARQSRFLQYRGFSNDHIASALASAGDDAPSLDLDFDDLTPDDDIP